MGESEVNDSRFSTANNVGRDQGFVSNRQDAGITILQSGLAEKVVDFFDRSIAFDYKAKVGDGTSNGRNTEREAVEEAFELGNRLGGSDGGPSSSGDDV
ncbi:MAG: hypothetical protein UX84_C0028G0001, partial [Microgenomates group bacterium GW2011_GWD1_47_13]